MGIIGFLVAGLIIGALARLFKPGRQNLSLLATLGLGVVGSVIGGVVANLLGTGDMGELNVLGFIVAVIASMALIGTAVGFARKAHGAKCIELGIPVGLHTGVKWLASRKWASRSGHVPRPLRIAIPMPPRCRPG